MTRQVLETMLHGLSKRNYAFGLKDVGDVGACGISKSSITRRFARMALEALAELMAMAGPLDRSDMAIL